MVKNPPASAGDARDAGLNPGTEEFPGGGDGNPHQYSSLENSMDRGAWWVTVHGVPKSRIGLSDWAQVMWCPLPSPHLFPLEQPLLQFFSFLSRKLLGVLITESFALRKLFLFIHWLLSQLHLPTHLQLCVILTSGGFKWWYTTWAQTITSSMKHKLHCVTYNKPNFHEGSTGLYS